MTETTQKTTPETKREDDLWAQGFGRSTRMNPDMTLKNYWNAPGESLEWKDKPHRLLYDLIGEILHLRAEIATLKSVAPNGELT